MDGCVQGLDNATKVLLFTLDKVFAWNVRLLKRCHLFRVLEDQVGCLSGGGREHCVEDARFLNRVQHCHVMPS